MQDFALVPLDAAEWEHMVDPLLMRLLGAMRCLGPNPLRGIAFWRFPAALLREGGAYAETLESLRGALSAPLLDDPAPRRATDPAQSEAEQHTPSQERLPAEARSAQQTARGRKRRMRRDDSSDSSGDEGSDSSGDRAVGAEGVGSQALVRAGQRRRYVFAQDSDDDDDQGEAAQRDWVSADGGAQQLSRGDEAPVGQGAGEGSPPRDKKRTRRVLMDDDSDEETKADEEEAAGEEVLRAVPEEPKRARLLEDEADDEVGSRGKGLEMLVQSSAAESAMGTNADTADLDALEAPEAAETAGAAVALEEDVIGDEGSAAAVAPIAIDANGHDVKSVDDAFGNVDAMMWEQFLGEGRNKTSEGGG